MSSPEKPSRPEKDESFKDKMKNSMDSFRKNEKIEEIYNYATTNVRDTIAYILLLIGLLLMLVESSGYGAAIVGIIFGLYFGSEIIHFWNNYKQFTQEQGLVRSIILGGTLIALFISAPFLFIGAGIAVAIRMMMWDKN